MRTAFCGLLVLAAAVLTAQSFAGGPKKDRPAKVIHPEGYATVRGKVTFEGEVPDLTRERQLLLATVREHKDADECLSGSGTAHAVGEEWWAVGKNNGVAHVAILLNPPAGQRFAAPDKATRRDEVVLRSPGCHFEPYVMTVYASAGKGEKGKSAGQTFRIHNTSDLLHTFHIDGEKLKGNQKRFTMPPDAEHTVKLKPQRHPIPVRCDVHPWMRAYVFVLDHPYATVTKGHAGAEKQKDFGTFTIERVPAGVDLQLVAWHPGERYFLEEGEQGRTIRLKEGETRELNLTIHRSAKSSAGR